MIVTVTLNPAVDKTCSLGRLTPGSVNRLERAVEVAGGKGINVARVLRQFHMSVAVLGFLGGVSGRMIEEYMERTGADCRFTGVAGQTRTNTNLLEADGRVTEILEAGPRISEKEFADFYKAFVGVLDGCQLMVLSGSAPAGIPVTIYRELITLCNRMGVKVFLDSSGELLREGVAAAPYLVKPNVAELEALAGRPLTKAGEIDRDGIAREARKLVSGGVRKVVVSLGAEGLCYADSECVHWESACRVKAVNTVACGDTVVASLCMSELAGEDRQLALHKAAALAAANASTPESARIPMETYLGLL